MLAAIWKAALQSRGEAYAKQFCLNQPGSKGKTPLMLACRNGCDGGTPQRSNSCLLANCSEQPALGSICAVPCLELQ